MDSYRAPMRDMRFILEKLVDLEGVVALPGFEDADSELVFSILEEAEKFAVGVLAPLNKVGDRQGCRIENGTVIMAGKKPGNNLHRMVGSAFLCLSNWVDRVCRNLSGHRSGKCITRPILPSPWALT